ncbi:MAG: oligosaccharide flippase family protein, partial [candidate division WOR-3 bacterium]
MITRLRTRTVAGLTWTGLSQLGGQVIQLATAVFLARRLLPVHFGTAGLALAIITPLAALAQLGMTAALIQRPGLTRAHYRTALISTAAASSLCGFIFLVGGGLAGRLFHNPLLPPVLRLYSILMVLGAVTAVESAILGRFLDFRSQALAALAARLVGSGTTVALAYANQGVMSIAWGFIALTATNLALIYPRARRHRLTLPDSSQSDPHSHFLSMFHYSSGVMAANLLDQLGLGLDTMLVARLMGPVALGYYSFAAQLALYLSRSLASVLDTVLFPSLARVHEDTGRLRRAYLKLSRALIWFSLPVVLVAALFAPWVVPCLFGGTWTPAVPLIQLLMLYALFLFVFNSLTNSILKATGRSRTLTIFSAIRVTGIALSVLFGSRLGLTGVTLTLVAFAISYWLGTLIVVTS